MISRQIRNRVVAFASAALLSAATVSFAQIAQSHNLMTSKGKLASGH